MPTNFRDLKSFLKPSDVKDIVDYASDAETTEAKLAKAFDHFDAQLTPKFERALSIDLRLAVDEFVDLMGARPDRTEDLEQWQPAFDLHVKAALGDDTLGLLGEAWSDMVIVNCELDDADAFERACKTGADAMLDAMLSASSKNKMLSAVGIAAGTFTNPNGAREATDNAEDLGVSDTAGVDDAASSADLGLDDLGLDDAPVGPASPAADTKPSGKRGRPTVLADGPVNEEALKVLIAVRENAVDSDTVLADIFGCSRSQIGNYAKRSANFAPSPAQYQQLRDIAAKRAQALAEALRVTGQ